jgi:hypothetical protein
LLANQRAALLSSMLEQHAALVPRSASLHFESLLKFIKFDGER